MRKDFVVSIRAVWLIVSYIILLTLASPWLIGRENVVRLTPLCQSKVRYGTPCSFCGMTTSFLAISQSRFSDAAAANRGGIPLYAVFVVNELCVVAFFRKGGLACKYSA